MKDSRNKQTLQLRQDRFTRQIFNFCF